MALKTRVFLNPGHDVDYDSGACHRTGVRECDVALDISNKVKYYLEQVGYDVKVFQSDNLCNDSIYDDRPVSVCSKVNSWPADVFVSIHCNAFNEKARGSETLYYPGSTSGLALAEYIQKQICDSLPVIDRGVKERSNLAVLKHTNMAAVLVELAFIDNDEDLELLLSRSDDFARAVARGITDFFSAD